MLGALTTMMGCARDSAIDVAQKFWDAAIDQDIEKARSYATRETADVLTIKEDAGDQEGEVEFGQVTVQHDRTIIETTMRTTSGDSTMSVPLKTVVVQEDGEWKVDVTQTMMSMFGDAMGEMMQGMGEAMEEAMEEIGKTMMEEMKKGMEKMEGSVSTSN
jgi:hypothetical protein